MGFEKIKVVDRVQEDDGTWRTKISYKYVQVDDEQSTKTLEQARAGRSTGEIGFTRGQVTTTKGLVREQPKVRELVEESMKPQPTTRTERIERIPTGAPLFATKVTRETEMPDEQVIGRVSIVRETTTTSPVVDVKGEVKTTEDLPTTVVSQKPVFDLTTGDDKGGSLAGSILDLRKTTEVGSIPFRVITRTAGAVAAVERIPQSFVQLGYQLVGKESPWKDPTQIRFTAPEAGEFQKATSALVNLYSARQIAKGIGELAAARSIDVQTVGSILDDEVTYVSVAQEGAFKAGTKGLAKVTTSPVDESLSITGAIGETRVFKETARGLKTITTKPTVGLTANLKGTTFATASGDVAPYLTRGLVQTGDELIEFFGTTFVQQVPPSISETVKIITTQQFDEGLLLTREFTPVTAIKSFLKTSKGIDIRGSGLLTRETTVGGIELVGRGVGESGRVIGGEALKEITKGITQTESLTAQALSSALTSSGLAGIGTGAVPFVSGVLPTTKTTDVGLSYTTTIIPTAKPKVEVKGTAITTTRSKDRLDSKPVSLETLKPKGVVKPFTVTATTTVTTPTKVVPPRALTKVKPVVQPTTLPVSWPSVFIKVKPSPETPAPSPPPFITTPTTGLPPLIIPPLRGDRSVTQKSLSDVKGKRGYSPSLTSVVLDIRSEEIDSPSVFTGLELRPVRGKKKKKKALNLFNAGAIKL